MRKRAPRKTVNLYEVVNHVRRESLLAVVSDALGELVTRLDRPRPQPIAHWGPSETFAVEQIAAEMPAADAEEFVERFLSNVRWQGWKVLVWRG